ncbi:hypothetical protein SUDANB151_07375 [Streptomyces sp. enrichment culture]
MLTIASRGTLHGTALGTYRWVVERSFAWLHGSGACASAGNGEPTSTKHSLTLACCLITHRQLRALR